MQCLKIRRSLSLARVAVLLFAVPVALPAAAELHTVTLATTLGDIVLELDDDRAPVTVDNFLRYVDAGFYDDTIFHRVIEGFMVQGGGFTRKYGRKDTRAPITNEANNGLSNRRYTIAMARTNSPHSATAQFFINTVDNRNLDHTGPTSRGWGYTVFGRVVEGTEIVQQISEVPTGAGGPFSSDAPREAIVIISASQAGSDEPVPVSGEGELETDVIGDPSNLEPTLGASDADSAASSKTLETGSDGLPVTQEKIPQRTSLQTD